MKLKPCKNVLAGVLLALLFGCASDNILLAPDSADGAQLKPDYLVGAWCNNRDLTAEINRQNGASALVNLSTLFWRFRASGKWEDSPSGWMYAYYGKWELTDVNTLVLDRLKSDPESYSANFKNQGKDLYLRDEQGQYLVLSRCE